VANDYFARPSDIQIAGGRRLVGQQTDDASKATAHRNQ
jgi:hypothetical protein